MDRVKSVNDISAFLNESQGCLNKILEKLKWTTDKLLADKEDKDMITCPINANHRIPKRSVDSHLKLCRISSLQIDIKEILPSSNFYYASSPAVVSIQIDKARYESFKGKSVPNHQHRPLINYQLSGSRIPEDDIEVEEIRDPYSSLMNASSYTIAPSPKHEIRNIIQWELIPFQYKTVDIQQLDMTRLKSWLIKNLPQNLSFKSVVDGDIQLLNFICSCLAKSCNPDGLVCQLRELLEFKTRPFVLKLWKHICILIICIKNDISEEEMAALITLSASAKQKRSAEPTQEDDTSAPPSSCGTDTDAMLLPMDFVRYDLNQSQMLAQYEYVVKTGKATNKANELEISDLFGLEGQAKCDEDDEASKSRLEMMAEMRDYKRRRQSYRAKNVHITKRTATDAQRDLLEVMMGAMENIHRKHHQKAGNEVLTEETFVNVDEVTEEKDGEESQDGKQFRDDKDPRETRDEGHKREETKGERHRDRDDRHRNRDRDRDRDRYRKERRRSRSRDRDADRDRSRHKHKHKHRHDR